MNNYNEFLQYQLANPEASAYDLDEYLRDNFNIGMPDWVYANWEWLQAISIDITVGEDTDLRLFVIDGMYNIWLYAERLNSTKTTNSC